jgi:hypothetical protein
MMRWLGPESVVEKEQRRSSRASTELPKVISNVVPVTFTLFQPEEE